MLTGTPASIHGCIKGQLRTKGKEGAFWGPMVSPLGGPHKCCSEPSSGFGEVQRALWDEAFLTLAVLWLTEALLLIWEAVAGTIASFNPPTLPWLVPPNDAAT